MPSTPSESAISAAPPIRYWPATIPIRSQSGRRVISSFTISVPIAQPNAAASANSSPLTVRPAPACEPSWEEKTSSTPPKPTTRPLARVSEIRSLYTRRESSATQNGEVLDSTIAFAGPARMMASVKPPRKTPTISRPLIAV